MEELNFNTSGENSLNYNNMSLNNSDTKDGNYNYYNLINQIELWLNWITIAIALLLILIVIIALFFQVKKGQDAPVYVINLIVSDLIQLGCRISSEIYLHIHSFAILYSAILVSVGFMVCISCERYLVIANPLWYKFRRNIKIYVVVCSVVWILPVGFLILFYLTPGFRDMIFLIVFLLLPFPLLIFFVVGTFKALSGAIRVPKDEKRRITAIQAVVLLNYTLLYLPIVIWLMNLSRLVPFKMDIIIVQLLYLVCTCLSPLADTTLYLLSRKSIIDKFLASLCSKICNNLELSSTEYELRSPADTETV